MEQKLKLIAVGTPPHTTVLNLDNLSSVEFREFESEEHGVQLVARVFMKSGGFNHSFEGQDAIDLRNYFVPQQQPDKEQHHEQAPSGV